MADGFRFNLSKLYSNKIAEKLDRLNDNDLRIEVNEIIAQALKDYVPTKSGALSQTHIYPKMIVWGEGLPYAKYQYYGKVYKRNLPIYTGSKRDGTYRIIGWYSLPNKYNSGDSLGTPGWKDGWTFGYTLTKASSPRAYWTKAYEWGLKSKTNREISILLNKIARNW